MIIAFDVDDTLIIPAIARDGVADTGADVPNYETIELFRWFQQQGHAMVVWSGGGEDYALMWARKLGLEPCSIWTKEKNNRVDIAFDDCDVDLAKVNVKVKRMNNHISRRAWNNHQGI